MKLQEASIRWAVNHLYKENDTDLFPRPIELDIIQEMSEEVITICKEIEIGNYKWRSARRFLIPKDEFSYRLATQLDTIDSIVLSAILFEIGDRIEARRIPTIEGKVFSYGFNPLPDGTLYANKNAWKDFWTTCMAKAEEYEYVAYSDISDFYNQIYHHTIENQLGEAGVENQVIKSILGLLLSLTARSSRGLPIGPHSSHLLAEMSLIPFDNLLKIHGIEFCRYVDDIVVFADSQEEAKIKIYQIADILDKQQRLVLQRGKIKVYKKEEFIYLCERMLINNPINDKEREILEVINEYSDNNPYVKIELSEIAEEDLRKLSKETIEGLLDEYLKEESPSFERIRWFFRRLSQIGLPHAIDFAIFNLEELTPAINDVCLYINSCSENYESDWKEVGSEILAVLDQELIQSNDYFKITLLNLFVRNQELNHFNLLLKRFNRSNEVEKRKIILASLNHDNGDWIRQFKESFLRYDEWIKKAILISSTNLPREEKEYFYKGIKSSITKDDIIEEIIIKWCKR